MFRYRRHEDDIIVLAVRWYVAYRLSLRDLVEMLADGGLDVYPLHDLALGPEVRTRI
jgi:transposase-like protein